jgi:hypothetical protein
MEPGPNQLSRGPALSVQGKHADGLGPRRQLGIITDEELLSVVPTAATTPGA